MKVEFIGPHDEVEVPSLGLAVTKGHPVDADEKVAAALLEQTDNWAPADADAKKLAARIKADQDKAADPVGDVYSDTYGGQPAPAQTKETDK